MNDLNYLFFAEGRKRDLTMRKPIKAAKTLSYEHQIVVLKLQEIS